MGYGKLVTTCVVFADAIFRSVTDKAAIQAVVDRMTRAVEKTPKAEGTINVTQPVRGGLHFVLC
jgi:low affinity Fe/Cu permease